MKKIYFKMIAAVFFIISIIMVVSNVDLFYVFPFFKNYSVSSINFVDFGNDGSKIINNDSGTTLLKLNKNNEIVFFKKGGKFHVSENFSSVYGHCNDKNGNIYLYDLELSSAQKVEEEFIIKLNKDGKNFETIFKDKFGKEANKGIARILIFEDKLYYIYNNINEFYIKDSKNEIVRKYLFDTDLVLWYSLFDLDNIVILTKNGHFLKINSKNEIELLYDSNVYENSIPFCFSILDDGSLIYSDIGTREFNIVRRNSKTKEVLFEQGEFDKRPINMWFSAKGVADNLKLIATDGKKILYYDSYLNKPNYLENLSYSKEFLILYLFFVFFVLSILLYFIYIFIFIFKKISSSKSFVTKISASVIVGTILITGVFCLISFESFDERLISEIKKREEVVSLLISESLPFKKMESITKNSQYDTPEYKSVVDSVKNIFDKHKSMTEGFYCVLYKLTHENKVLSVLYDLNAVFPTLTPSNNFEEDSIEYEIMSTKEGFVSEPEMWPTGYFVYSYNPIINHEGESIGIIEVGTNINSLTKDNNQLLFTLFLNISSMAVFIILLVLEILIFIKERGESLKNIILKNKNNNLINFDKSSLNDFSIPIKDPDAKISINMSSGMSRLLVFLIFFSTSIVSSFSSLYSFSITPENLSASKEFLSCIPISADILLGLFSIPVANILIKFVHTRNTAIFFSIMFCISMFLKIIPNIWIFILANALCGLGWGGILRIVSAQLAKSNKIEYFNGYDASSINGITCALIFGSFLINFLDYFSIFLISALISLFVLFFVLIYVKHQDIREFFAKNDEKKTISVLSFLFSQKVFIFLFLVLVPMSICDYFVSYFFPITAEALNLNEAHIGYVYTANRLCSVVFGNLIVTYFSKFWSKKYVLFLYMILFSASVAIFARFSTIAVLIISVIAMGFANSFGYSFLSYCFLNIKEVEKIGTDRASSINTILLNVSYMIAPFIFSFIMTSNMKLGLYIISGTILICSLIFLIFNLKNKKIESK